MALSTDSKPFLHLWMYYIVGSTTLMSQPGKSELKPKEGSSIP
jgi:hypothetical protein